MEIETNHREQYDSKNELQIIRIDGNLGPFYTLVLYNPTTKKYKYSDVPFESLKDAHECFDKIMELNLNKGVWKWFFYMFT